MGGQAVALKDFLPIYEYNKMKAFQGEPGPSLAPLHLKAEIGFIYSVSPRTEVGVGRQLRNIYKGSAKPRSLTPGQRGGDGPQTEPPPSRSAGCEAQPPPLLPPSDPESPFRILELSTMGTPNDQAVLQAIFNPDTPFGDVVGLDLGEEAQKEEADEDGVFPRAQLEQSKALELQGVMAAEAGDLSTALERFGQAINLLPERASAYNNRAQALRLQGDVAGALEDLERALELSRGRGRAARQGFVQRGLLARLQGRDDDARRDFERAARLGSPFARRQLVLLNPYAALCNRMLADMMAQLRGPAPGAEPARGRREGGAANQ
ncbi:hypothetical protein HPG69_018623 [Diceros bicornis minor]|uniref:Tetratricopeptide repeat protein 36 n=1 Tax=Diceros bicornis minor TaxID=77932 RepID=A0A7J7EZS7_DICBM|nr:hypothetical protein HPG69_018623 [Diceros bicornis minor]